MVMTLHSGLCDSPSQEEHFPLLLTRKKKNTTYSMREAAAPSDCGHDDRSTGGRHVASRVTESAYGEIRVVDDWVKRTLSPRRAH